LAALENQFAIFEGKYNALGGVTMHQVKEVQTANYG